MKTKLGFTLIELLVVVLIIGILAAIAVPQYQLAALKSKLARAKQSLSDIRKAYDFYRMSNGAYPENFSDLDYAIKLEDSNIINTSDYICEIKSKEIDCDIDGEEKLKYVMNFGTYHKKKITTFCIANTADESDIYHKVCANDTGIATSNASCTSTRCIYVYETIPLY